ncbi:GGDEF domain-containing protein [Paractinoplanes atraurantiacus]|uniref:Diguanylate cyclase (GGDEF) domain-containing protein n=1 Tax=Paractinoplanes atraurantiacus TaxID=1036182 RepID=A0A285KJG1_9ACTN|nr:GGDEF domain-containing protein [Actinoplanes atraurantiacus]SNY72769.1 diguanylate cyclase (GGDEF) domain-containing protein [Actinoplanes atraurantiacus]
MARQSVLLTAAGAAAAGYAAAAVRLQGRLRRMEAGNAAASSRLRRLQAQLHRAEVRLRTDALTGAANRSGLMSELERRSAGNADFMVALLDLDNFKQVNDRLGHAAGDKLLVDIVARLSVVMTAVGGMVARLGGDELVVVASSASVQDSRAMGPHLVLAAAEPLPGDDDLWVSASVGLVHALPGDDPRRLLATADHLMYQAKLAGGGKVAEQDLEYELDEVLDRPAIRSRDMQRGHAELAAAPRRAE